MERQKEEGRTEEMKDERKRGKEIIGSTRTEKKKEKRRSEWRAD